MPKVDSIAVNAKQLSSANHPTTAVLIANNNYPSVHCYCQQSHASQQCTVIASVEDRYQYLRKTGRCYVCLRKGHLSRRCRAQGRYSKCSERHHISTCTQGNQNTKLSRDRAGTQVSKESTLPMLNPSVPPFKNTATSCNFVGASNPVVLQSKDGIATQI